MSETHTIQDLHQMQALPLYVKVQMTKRRISQWMDEYGSDGVFVSFSGGKDSTVLLDIAREVDPDVKGMFVDTGLEYPEIREFVKTYDNIDWVKPKMNFRAVIEKYGYPFISKEVSETVWGARGYLTKMAQKVESSRTNERTNERTNAKWGQHCLEKLYGCGRYATEDTRGGRQEVQKTQRNRGVPERTSRGRLAGSCQDLTGNGQRRPSASSGDLRKEGKGDTGQYP